MRVVVYNTDGVNAYAAEVASVVARGGADVLLLDPVGSEHRPGSGVAWTRVLPANYGGDGAARQALRLLRGMCAVAGRTGLRGDALLVAWSRFPAERLLFALLALLGRPVVYVLHNPGPREPQAGWSGRAHRALLARCPVVVVHAEGLVAQVPAPARARVRVCAHPPYLETVTRVQAAPLPLDGDRQWSAFVGALRPDKGIDLLPEVFALLPDAVLRRTGLVVCGWGSLPRERWSPLVERGLALVDQTSTLPVPQEALQAVLAARPLVLAPYRGATQSGTVILALSAGCRALAFDRGGIGDVLDAAGLVPDGDVPAFAAALAAGGGGRGRSTLDAWADDCAHSWTSALRQAYRG